MSRKQISHACAECGTAFQATDRKAAFCSVACRTASNNRRRERGALLYDLLVHQRFNREVAQERQVRSLIDRMVSNWVAEDRAAGRRVLRPLQDCIEAALPHGATHLGIVCGRGRAA